MKAILALVALFEFSTHVAAGDAPHGFAVSTQLDQDSIVLGQPLIINWTAVNATDGPVVAKLGEGGRAWIDVKVRTPSGRFLDLPPRRILSQHDMAAIDIPLSKGRQHGGQVVVVLPYAQMVPGTYTVGLAVHLQGRQGEARGTGPLVSLVADDRTLALAVSAPERGALLSAADALAQRIRQTTQVDTSLALTDALFAMPAEMSTPVWLNLVVDRSVSSPVRWRAFQLLSKFPSASAVDAVAEVWADPQQPEDIEVTAKNSLVEMWWNASPAVKAQIAHLYAARTGKMFSTKQPLSADLD